MTDVPGDGKANDKRAVDDFEFALVSKRLDAQLGRIEKIDAKVGVLIAAVIAAIAFIIQGAKTPLDFLLTLCYLVPLLLALLAFKTHQWDDAPDPGHFSEQYGKDAQLAKRAVVNRMLKAYDTNKAPLVHKGHLFDWALWLSVGITLALMVVRVLEEYHIMH